MNQILLTEEINKNKTKTTKTISKDSIVKENNSSDIKKIITFFAIVIIVFGIAIGSIYGFRVYKNKKQDNNNVSSNNPSVSTTKNENNTITIVAKSEAGINKIIYNWDNGEIEEQDENGSTIVEVNKEIPQDATKVDIEVVDMNGNSTLKTEKTIISEAGNEPIIKTFIIGNDNEDKKLKIVVNSEEDMDYIIYKWNDGEEVRLQAEENTKRQEEIIEFERGDKNITITAVDKKNNKATITQPYKVGKEPTIDVTKVDDTIYMKVSHDIGIKSIEYNVNNKIFTYDENYSGYDINKKEIEFSYKLQEGENIVIITATSVEDITNDPPYRGICTYSRED